MKRAISMALVIVSMAAGLAEAHCPVTATLYGPLNATWHVEFYGQQPFQTDPGSYDNFGGTLSSGTASVTWTFGEDQGGYGWAQGTIGGLNCGTVYFGFYTGPSQQFCSEDNLGSAAAPSCEPRFVSDGLSCQAYCDGGPQMRAPWNPAPIPGLNAPVSPKAYPSPYKGPGYVTLSGFATMSTIKIYDYNGRLIRTLSADVNGSAQWNTQDQTGALVGSGVYLIVSDSGGVHVSTKVAIQR